jgi:hypothetical protein
MGIAGSTAAGGYGGIVAPIAAVKLRGKVLAIAAKLLDRCRSLEIDGTMVQVKARPKTAISSAMSRVRWLGFGSALPAESPGARGAKPRVDEMAFATLGCGGVGGRSETGAVKMKFVIAHDCGRVINHDRRWSDRRRVAHGIGNALLNGWVSTPSASRSPDLADYF